MAISRLRFRFVQPAWDFLRFSKFGIVGRDMNRRGFYIATRARAQVGVDTGKLRRTIRHNTYNGRSLARGPYTRVSAGDKNTRYALTHHQGTRPHEITPSARKSVLKFNVGGRTVYATRVMHPGTRENNYLTDHLAAAVRI